MLTVEQADRDAAAELLPRLDEECGLLEQGLMRSGEMDADPLVQAFAAHRIAGEQAIVAWLRGLGYTAICPGSYFAGRIERGEHLKDTP